MKTPLGFAFVASLLLATSSGIKLDLQFKEPAIGSRQLDSDFDGLRHDLTDDGNVQYYSTIGFGKDSDGNINWTPVIFDTGSSWLWAGSVACECPGLNEDTKIDDSAITTWKYSGREIHVAYGKGDATGKLGTMDTYFTDDIYVHNQHVLIMEDAAGFSRTPTSGIFGLSHKKGSEEYPTMIYKLKSEGHIPSMIFTVALRPDSTKPNEGSYINVGVESYDEVLEGESFHYVDLNTDGGYEYYYSFDVGKFAIGNISLLNYVAIADTGTSAIVVPASYINELKESFSSDLNCTFDSSDRLMCDCDSIDSFPSMTIQIDTFQWTLKPDQFMYHYRDRCIWQVQALGTDTLLILGDIFLRNVVTVFDLENEQIGFASNTGQELPVVKALVTGHTSGEDLSGSAVAPALALITLLFSMLFV